ncbi:hypothetical protein [Coleofasciculus sp. FACHB-1120]|uniref:hypothetical protein n=1 Tax=Coleofasciculus sp. FACHB-1120 TaxID=2692783 RepID=UPI0016859824|nr:hypothetical protein [Coleofasciculus sp. FACHB-1120]MBD2744527.1 hypothetical protein [Coleofasciculus sp. FACHB-1120]
MNTYSVNEEAQTRTHHHLQENSKMEKILARSLVVITAMSAPDWHGQIELQLGWASRGARTESSRTVCEGASI